MSKLINVGVKLLIAVMVLVVPMSAFPQDLDDFLKGALQDYLEGKAEEAGIDLPGTGKPKNVDLIFIGADTPTSDTFEALYVNEVAVNTPPVSSNSRTAAEQACFARVQNKIAWNTSGSKRWNPNNIYKLCDGATVASAPPSCFANVMTRGTMWGKKSFHKMNWMLASQLCAKATVALLPLRCLKGRIASNYSLENAINACDANPLTKGVPTKTKPKPKPRPVAVLKQKECYKYVQGNIAWDSARKNKNWNKTNVNRLCKGTTSKYSPGNCFSYAMHKSSQWRKRRGQVMSWSKAIDLCEGTSNANKTTTCFKNSIASGKTVDQAVARCDR